MSMRRVHLWDARAPQAVLLRMLSSRCLGVPRLFADGPIRGSRAWPPPEPR